VGEQYRYEAPQKGRLRAFYQWNCDIFGQSEPAADAELIALCAEALKAHGLTSTDFAIRLSDRDLWLAWLAGLGFEGDRASQVLVVVDKMERDKIDEQIRKLTPLFGPKALDFIGKVEKLKSLRSLEELADFLSDENLTEEIRCRLDKRLADWGDLLRQLKGLGVADCIRIDLGVVRGLAYYTGFVFEAFEATGKGRALAGGGRYDNLVEKLGYQPMPATGFAMGDVTLRILLEEKGLLPKLIQAPDLYCVVGGEAERHSALRLATSLRAAGRAVEVPIKTTGFVKQLAAASASGARLALIIGSEENNKGMVKIRDLAAKKEAEFPQANIVEAVEQVLAEGLA
jgi:histidyl-tRNA synthetase